MSAPDAAAEPAPPPRGLAPALFVLTVVGLLLALPAGPSASGVGLQEDAFLARWSSGTGTPDAWSSVADGAWRPLGRWILGLLATAGDVVATADAFRSLQRWSWAWTAGGVACIAFWLATTPRRVQATEDDAEDTEGEPDPPAGPTRAPAVSAALAACAGAAVYALQPARAGDLLWTPHVFALFGGALAVTAVIAVRWCPQQVDDGSPWRAAPAVLIGACAVLVEPALAALPLVLAALARAWDRRVPRRAAIALGLLGAVVLLRSYAGVPREPAGVVEGLERWTLVVGAPLRETFSLAATAPWTSDLAPAGRLPVLRDALLVALLAVWGLWGLRRGGRAQQVVLLHLLLTGAAWLVWPDGGDTVPSTSLAVALLAPAAAAIVARRPRAVGVAVALLLLCAAGVGGVTLREHVTTWTGPEAVHERVAETAPGHPQVLAARGEAARRRGDHSVAAEQLSRALVELPVLARAHVALGRARLDQGRPQEALTSFEAAVRHRPDLATAQRELGRLQFRYRTEEEALRSLRTATRLAPADPLAWLALAETLERLGRDDDARAARARLEELRE